MRSVRDPCGAASDVVRARAAGCSLAKTAIRAPASACRDGRAPAEGLALSAVREGRLVGTVRLWHVSAGGVAALVLGRSRSTPSCRKLASARR